MTRLWTEKFFPQDFNEFIGNVEVVDVARRWASSWDKGKKDKPLLFFGATGTGKTCLAVLIARHFGWGIFELNASDFRTKEVIEKMAGAASQGASFSGKKRLILLDEIDGLQARDKGGAAAIVKIAKNSNNPVILTANDIYGNQKLSSIREQSKLMQFKKINYLSIAKRIREILEKEGTKFDADAIKLFAKNCGGDFRSALLDVQTLSLGGNISMKDVESLGYRERQENVFKVLDVIFKGKSVDEVRKARFQSNISDDLLFRWVEENIPRVYNCEDTANAFSVLSRADIFEGRIFNRQHYGFKRYSSELFSTGVALSKEGEYHGWLKMQFPSLLKKLSRSSSSRNTKKELAKKMGVKMHSSSRTVMVEDFAFIKMILKEKDKAVQYAAAFDLDEKQIAFLLDSKPSTKKVKNIFDAAQELKKKEMIAKRKPFEALNEKSLNSFEENEAEQDPPAEKPEEQGHSQTKLF